MSKLSFDNAIKMLPQFAGLPSQDLNLFEKKCEFVFKHIEETIVNDVLEALLCNLSGKALCITQHKTILNYKELITFLRSNFGNNYSGHRLSADEVTPDKGKIDCVKKESIPKNTTDIKVFLGLKGYYRRFIEE